MSNTSPEVFLCHATEDKPLASKIAHDLMEAGIDTFYDDWSIAAGDSLREKIDEGIEECSHFVVLLTPRSLNKRWVQAEIDGGFVKRIEGSAVFIPVRYELPMSEVPPLLRGLLSPELTEENYESALRRLIGDLWGVSRKPDLGAAPSFGAPVSNMPTGFSKGAERIAKLLVDGSNQGREGDPHLAVDEIKEEANLTIEEIEIAVDELESHGCAEPLRILGAPPLGYTRVKALVGAFLIFDPIFMGWNPAEDAVKLAAELVNSDHGALSSAEACEQLEWSPRRLNPAVAVLINSGAVLESRAIDPQYISPSLRKNNRTARFARQHS